MTAPPAAVIHDIRYSRFTGDLRARPFAVTALARSSALRGLGLRRSTGAKVWPGLLIAAAFTPAFIVAAIPLFIRDGSSEPIMDYDDVLISTIVVLLAFTATTVPSLVTRDRGDRVLSLYFSTALSPVEYVAGKVLAAWSLLLLITFGPLLVSWLGRLISADKPLDWVGDNVDDLPRLVAAGLVVSAFHGTLALVLGSLTGRRVFAVGGYLAVMLVSPIVAGLVYGFGGEKRAALLLDLASVPFVAANSVLGLPGDAEEVMAPVSGAWAVWAVVVLGGLVALLARYRSGREG